MREYSVSMPLHKLTIRVTLVNDDICFLKMYFLVLARSPVCHFVVSLCVYLQTFIPKMSPMNDDGEC